MFEAEGEYALSKDVDVALWLDYREYKQHLPTIRDAGDFVIVNSHLHDYFDDFKRSTIEPHISYLQMNSLLQLYLHQTPRLKQSLIKKYGHTYFRLSPTQVDELCRWVTDTRTEFWKKGSLVLSTGPDKDQPSKEKSEELLSIPQRGRCEKDTIQTKNIAAMSLVCKKRQHNKKTMAETQGPILIKEQDDCVPPTKKGTWINTSQYTLSSDDRSVLLSPVGWLNDRLITAAQVLLKNQFGIPGLQSPLLGETMAFDIHHSEFIQILFDGYQHWLLISNIGAKEDEVIVYDSLQQLCIGSRVRNQIAAIFASEAKQITIHFMDVQPQKGGYDCALFAIAFATALAHGARPENLHFKQNSMRKHFHKSLEKEILTMFPAVSRKSRGILSSDTIELYCVCRMPEILPMVECSGCSAWYHTSCVEVPASALNESSIEWFCFHCSQ